MLLTSFPICQQLALQQKPPNAQKMCESHTTYHLCGHVKIKTIVQCADIIDKMITSNWPTTRNHQVCKDSVSENVYVFPDICDKCKKTGVIGGFMELPGVKFEVFKAWEAKRKRMEVSSDNDNESDKIRDLETLDNISVPDEGTISISDTADTVASSTHMSQASSTASNGTTPDLSQLKTRVGALKTRTERLVTKIRAQRPPALS